MSPLPALAAPTPSPSLLTLLTLTLTLLTTTPAVSAAADFSQWQAPGPNDLRSPCPGLNSLANHGILPRDGRGMTVPILVKGLQEGMNVDTDFAALIGSAGLLSSPHPFPASFDLSDLSAHNYPIEHDASLSRADYHLTGDAHTFNSTIFATILAHYAHTNTTSIPAAAAARYARVATEAARDPSFTYTPQQFILSYGETALYLSVLGDPATGVAPVAWVRVFFEQERLPYVEGWRPTAVATGLRSLARMAMSLNEATGEEMPEGLVIARSTLRQAFSGLDPVTGQVAGARGGAV